MVPRLRVQQDDGKRYAQRDNQPASGFWPTVLWQQGVPVVDEYELIVPEELVKAVRAVGTGRRYITPLVAELLASECAADEEGPLHNRLSERELQVFTRIARGVSPAVMANELGLSVKTVSTYRARILEKMGMRSNAEIAAYAVRNQLVE